ncbi:MAG: hypothetical protein KDN20_18430 [Verrucomicrobiae bacterium]|nr:hypothetical protein [Verrucomicrobiae bacterium]
MAFGEAEETQGYARWFERVGQMPQLSWTNQVTCVCPGDSSDGHKYTIETVYSNGNLLQRVVDRESVEGRVLYHINAFDGKRSYFLNSGLDYMIVESGYHGGSETGMFFHENPINSFVTSFYQPKSYFDPFLFPRLQDAKDVVVSERNLVPSHFIPVESSFGEAVELKWDGVDDLRKNAEASGRPDSLGRPVLVRFLKASGIPIYAKFETSEGYLYELVIDKMTGLKSDGDEDLLFPAEYRYRARVNPETRKSLWEKIYRISNIKSEFVVDDSIFSIDPRKYGIKRIRDYDTD